MPGQASRVHGAEQGVCGVVYRVNAKRFLGQHAHDGPSQVRSDGRDLVLARGFEDAMDRVHGGQVGMFYGVAEAENVLECLRILDELDDM